MVAFSRRQFAVGSLLLLSTLSFTGIGIYCSYRSDDKKEDVARAMSCEIHEHREVTQKMKVLKPRPSDSDSDCGCIAGGSAGAAVGGGNGGSGSIRTAGRTLGRRVTRPGTGTLLAPPAGNTASGRAGPRPASSLNAATTHRSARRRHRYAYRSVSGASSSALIVSSSDSSIDMLSSSSDDSSSTVASAHPTSASVGVSSTVAAASASSSTAAGAVASGAAASSSVIAGAAISSSADSGSPASSNFLVANPSVSRDSAPSFSSSPSVSAPSSPRSGATSTSGLADISSASSVTGSSGSSADFSPQSASMDTSVESSSDESPAVATPVSTIGGFSPPPPFGQAPNLRTLHIARPGSSVATSGSSASTGTTDVSTSSNAGSTDSSATLVAGTPACSTAVAPRAGSPPPPPGPPPSLVRTARTPASSATAILPGTAAVPGPVATAGAPVAGSPPPPPGPPPTLSVLRSAPQRARLAGATADAAPQAGSTAAANVRPPTNLMTEMLSRGPLRPANGPGSIRTPEGVRLPGGAVVEPELTLEETLRRAMTGFGNRPGAVRRASTPEASNSRNNSTDPWSSEEDDDAPPPALPRDNIAPSTGEAPRSTNDSESASAHSEEEPVVIDAAPAHSEEEVVAPVVPVINIQPAPGFDDLVRALSSRRGVIRAHPSAEEASDDEDSWDEDTA